MDCEVCMATGLVAGTRMTYDHGAWKEIPARVRKTCPACHGERTVN